MHINKNYIFILVILLSLLMTSCGNESGNFDQEVASVVLLTQTAIANSSPSPAPTPELSGDYRPIGEQECYALNEMLTQQIGIPGTIISPEPFSDFATQKTGFGCKISFATNAADEDHDRLGMIGPTVLEANGWVEDLNYAAGGAGGSASGYRKGDQLCLTVNYVGPNDEALCGKDEIFLECLDRLAPEQISYGFELNCAQPVP